MSHAIVVEELGGPEVLRWREVDPPGEPGPGEARVRQTAVGLNFIDVYFRTGTYAAPGLPFVPGMEAAGVVEAVGDGVEDVAAGDRVAYAGGPLGAYAETRLVPADRLVTLPDGIGDEQAAASLLKGMTAEYLIRRVYDVRRGDVVLLHAAAGGVGTIACQWLAYLGATVVGTVSSDEKAETARAHGCHHPVVTSREDFVERVRELTGGAGVAVVYDSVGRDTLLRSLDCLRPRGLMVSFGQSSGKVEPLDVGVLSAKGSLYLTRPTLMTYTAARTDLRSSAAALFDVIRRGVVRVEIGQTFHLEDAADAHRALEGRRTVASTVLLP